MTTVSFIVRVALILLALACSLRALLPRSAPGWLGRAWCSLSHGKPLHPFRGRYICRVCLRSYPVRWEKEIA